MKQLFELQPQRMKVLVVANLLAIIGFFLLYQPFSPRPYSNLVYFFLMLLGGIHLAGATNYQFLKENPGVIPLTLGGSALMLIIYGLMRYAHAFFAANPEFAGLVDVNQWSFFVQPWIEMNPFLSVSGVIMIVVALEYFYRAYLQEFFSEHFSPRKAILLTALLSGIRGWGGGSLAGPIDFLLGLIWGWVYYRGGLLPAIIVHLCWDIPFVYFAP